ncbi:hypothetical protein BYT27DRAFT_6938374 [Phlegmacium glaucopus]|nr:hypothetical protein BYT27DRAFT_6938374 [Phlegmacium glaucopus]
MDKAIEDEWIVLGSMFIGTTISFVLYGVTCCQAIWYFRSQSGRTSKSMKALILSIWIAETLGCIFMFAAMLHTFFGPAMARAGVHHHPCRYWLVTFSLWGSILDLYDNLSQTYIFPHRTVPLLNITTVRS